MCFSILRDCVAVKPECKAFWVEWGNHTSLSRGGFIQPPPRGATDRPLRPAQRRRSYSRPHRQLFGKAARLTEDRAVRSRAQLVLSWKGITTSYSRTDGTVGFRQEVPGAVLSTFYKLKDSSGLLAKPAPLMVRRDPPVALVRVL